VADPTDLARLKNDSKTNPAFTVRQPIQTKCEKMVASPEDKRHIFAETSQYKVNN
jgi:hypothetical protein